MLDYECIIKNYIYCAVFWQNSMLRINENIVLDNVSVILKQSIVYSKKISSKISSYFKNIVV